MGGSRLGGVPDLPQDFAWPRWQGYFVPLLAQFNLAEAGDTGELLASHGWLYVFGLRGVCHSEVPYVVFHLDCDIEELVRCDRPPDDRVWEPPKAEIEGLVLNPTVPLAKAGDAMQKHDDEVLAWLLPTEIDGYGDANKVAEDERLGRSEWTILVSLETVDFSTDSGRSDSAGFGDEAELHLLIRIEDLQRRDYSKVHPFVILTS